MEIRRVQMTGGSSYVITLPKEWIKSVNIKKNDQLGLTIQTDGTLLITPTMVEKQIKNEKIFNVNERIDEKYLLRQLIGAYISGYDSIKIRSKERIPSKITGIIRNFTQITIGQEVVEETDTSIVIKDLLNPTEMPFTSTLKRMHLVVKSMHEDVNNSLKTGNKKIAEEVIQRDNDVDRLHWLVARQHNIIMQNIGFAEKMGITIELANTSFLISRIIERIGDHVIRIAQNTINILDKIIDEKLLEKLQSASDNAINLFDMSITSFLRKDVKSANETIEIVTKLESKCKELNKILLKQKGDYVISIGYIIDSIRRIGDYSSDISENVINYLTGEEK